MTDAEKLELRRLRDFTFTLRTGLLEAQRVGGKNATMHVGDMLTVLDAFERGDLDHGLPTERRPQGETP